MPAGRGYGSRGVKVGKNGGRTPKSPRNGKRKHK